MFKFGRKKKTGCETPKFRKSTVPPQYQVPPMPPVLPISFGARLRFLMKQIYDYIVDRSDEIVDVIDKSGFKDPVLVIKLYADETIFVYVEEEEE